VILKTAVHVDDRGRQQGLAGGAARYFVEPFDPQALIAVVREVPGDGGLSSGTPHPA
jgi:DNA-binding response OmpR family regulator